ncbi:MAG: squalene/phytoene synthase family protein, partial [Nanoarchaeota archaeon]
MKEHIHSNLIWDLLPDISRNFAFTIPKLPKDISLDLAVGYALCRVIDTIEDCPLPHDEKVIHFQSFLIQLHGGKDGDYSQVSCKPHYEKLMNSVPSLMAIFQTLRK